MWNETSETYDKEYYNELCAHRVVNGGGGTDTDRDTAHQRHAQLYTAVEQKPCRHGGGRTRRIRLELVNRERSKDPELLLLDSGDFSQGSPYYTLFHGDVEVGLMNLMGYDAVTIGNHEFDFGLENMARLFRMAKFPVVCCNYDFTSTPLEGLVKPYVVIERKGVRIGVFGVCPELDGLVDENNCRGVKFENPESAAARTVKTLRENEKCDVVVCLSHLGWDDEGEEGDSKLMSETSGIDIVLGGHSHSYFKELKYVKNAEGKEIPMTRTANTECMWVG